MILFDSSVIIDARDTDSPFHQWAKRQIASAVQESGEGGAVNTVVVSEACVRAANREAVPVLLENFGLMKHRSAPFAKSSASSALKLKRKGRRG